jgi:hypothetical protein
LPTIFLVKTKYGAKKIPSGKIRTELKRAEDEIRTRDPHLGKVMLYQLSYFRIKEKNL